MQTNEVSVAIYCRLSRDDEDIASGDNSESINNQRNILKQYADERKWKVYDSYVDDGYTGLNFNREGFIRLKDDIRNKLINLVIVKDQSRIGRDNAGVDKFLYEFLPQYNVRCVGVADGLDTFNTQNKKASQVMGLTNEWYAEDISNKVRYALDAKRHDGQFIGSTAAYGYKKSEKNKNKLEIDEEVSWVIKKIFNLYLEGNGYVNIAKILNKNDIPSPSVYKNIFNSNSERIKKEKRAWSYHTIRRILLSEVYKGNLVQKTQKVINYKSKKKIATHPSERIIVEHTHDPIIDENTFNLVQDMISKRTKARPIIGKIHLFSGMVRCGDCGRAMQYRSDRDTFDCATYNQYGKDHCLSHKFKSEYLGNKILEEIKFMIKNLNEKKEQEKIHSEYYKTKKSKNIFDVKLNKVEKRLDEIYKFKKNIYEDYKEDILTKEEYLDFKSNYSQEEEELILQQENLKQEIKQNLNNNIKYEKIEYMYNKYINADELTREMLIEFVNDIEVYRKENNLDIKVNYKSIISL